MMYEVRGYRGMLNFLKGRQAERPSEALAALLGELALGPDGLPADAVREEWNEAVKAAFSNEYEPITRLNLE